MGGNVGSGGGGGGLGGGGNMSGPGGNNLGNLGGGGGGGGPMGEFDSPYNTYGLSTSFLEGLGIQGPLYNKIFIANVSIVSAPLLSLSPPSGAGSVGFSGRQERPLRRRPFCACI